MQFFETRMGQEFFQGNVPKIAKSLEDISKKMSKNVSEKNEIKDLLNLFTNNFVVITCKNGKIITGVIKELKETLVHIQYTTESENDNVYISLSDISSVSVKTPIV